MTTFLLMTVASIEVNFVIVFSSKAPNSTTSTFLSLDYMLCIYYLVWFKKNQFEIQALINSNNEIIAMTLAYAKKLGF